MSALNANIGEYRLVDFIGAGGMGEVYRAVHTRFGREIAIKILNQVEDRAIERFQNEVRIQSSLRHPAIAEYYGLHEFRGRPCLLMELVDGETLADRIRNCGALPPAAACAILRQIAEAVGYVHSQGIVHRDLKANNIKINSAGRVKVLDFGIARVTRGSHLTRAGMLIGTIENLAPEQINGGEADARSDIWALGVLLYEMVTARMPFESESLPALYDKIRSAEYTPPSALNRAVTPALEQVIAGCLRKKPALRFQSADTLIRALDAVPQIATIAPGKTARPQAHSPRWLLIGGGAAAVLLVLALIFFAGGAHHNLPKRTSSVAAADSDMKTITVDTLDGTADVYRDGKRVGATPYQVQAAMGKRVDLELRRSGYKSQAVEFDVTERTTYSYAMDPEK